MVRVEPCFWLMVYKHLCSNYLMSYIHTISLSYGQKQKHCSRLLKSAIVDSAPGTTTLTFSISNHLHAHRNSSTITLYVHLVKEKYKDVYISLNHTSFLHLFCKVCSDLLQQCSKLFGDKQSYKICGWKIIKFYCLRSICNTLSNFLDGMWQLRNKCILGLQKTTQLLPQRMTNSLIRYILTLW